MRLVETPPIRRLFVPRDGYVLFEADLKRADPQVVAKESGEEALLQVFRDGADVYTNMGKELYEKDKISSEERQWNKNAINGIDYAAQAKTMATTLHTTQDKAAKYVERWRGPSGLYPGIGYWHKKTDQQLYRTHTVHNVYGFRRLYTDRIKAVLPQALAWIASSTVSVTINRGMKFVFGPNVSGNAILSEEDLYDPWNMEKYIGIPEVELLLQVHDSIIAQIPKDRVDELMPKIVKMMEVEIPYKPTPLVIPVTVKFGPDGEAWGDLMTWKDAA